MSNTPDLASCLSADNGESELLPLSPFYALSYHFGMLLGVDDFKAEQSYHRGKMRLHNAWLHREGVVWGLDVQAQSERGEILVLPGLALDAAGHELHLEADACVNVSEWFDAHREDDDFTYTDADGIIRFDAHVVIRFRACLTRQVPAMAEPCDGSGNSNTAYSRVFETVELLLRPGLAPIKKLPYHRLRLLFALDEPQQESGTTIPSDQEVLDARANILALAPEQQPAAYLEAFRRFAAFDEIELQPAQSADGSRTLLFPGDEQEPVVLANLRNVSLKTVDSRRALDGVTVETWVRPSHVATATIQELLCGPLFQANAGPSEGPALGPRVDRDSVRFEEKRLSFRVDKSLHAASIKREAFALTRFDTAEGWQDVYFNLVNYNDAELEVELEVDNGASGLYRFIARGTDRMPLLGVDLLPLAGAIGDPPPTSTDDGKDFVFMRDYAPSESAS